MKEMVYEHFNSISSMINALSTRPENSVFKGKKLDSKMDNYSFNMTHSLDEAYDLCLNGWDEKLAEVKAQFTAATRPNKNGAIDRRRTYNHVVGYTPNVPNAILGLPQSMITTDKQPQKVKVVSIVYSPTGNCTVSADDLIKAGIIVLNIVNQLELNGIRVNLVLQPKGSSDDHQDTAMLVDVKSYRDPLDLRKLCFPLIHPSFFRRLGFRWLETVPGLTDTSYAWGYGHTTTGRDGYKEELVKAGAISENDYYLSYYIIEKCKFDRDAVMKAAGITI